MPSAEAGRSRAVAFIFGAGASKPWLPTQQELVLGLWRKASRPYPDGFPISRIWPAKAYLQRTFPGLPNSISVNFEDIVGPLEISEADEYWFHHAGYDRDGRLITNRTVLDALDTWLAWALDPSDIPKSTHDARWQDCYEPRYDARITYARLIALLRELALLDDAVFVSLNYDVLLDRALLATGDRTPDYCVEAFLDETRPQKETVPLLKVHGSLSWRVCEVCHVLVDIAPAVVWPESKCPKCGSDRARPMLIRPTLLKDFRHRVWKDVWRSAGRGLATAEHWVFIGYSLPLADVWMLRLLTQSLRSGIRRGRVRRISVVDPADVRDRFKLIFRDVQRWEEEFEVWIERCRAAKAIL